MPNPQSLFCDCVWNDEVEALGDGFCLLLKDKKDKKDKKEKKEKKDKKRRREENDDWSVFHGLDWAMFQSSVPVEKAKRLHVDFV